MTAGRIGIPSGYRTEWAPWPASTATQSRGLRATTAARPGPDPVAWVGRDNGREAETGD
jgi:hypothetical protein